jgi:hypothetical protein
MLCHLEQVDDAGETTAPSDFRRDLGEADLEHVGHEDLAGRQRVPVSYLHMWSLPEADRRPDFTAANAIAERANELHGQA